MDREKFHCPICKEKGEPIEELVSRGQSSRGIMNYLSIDVIYDNKQLFSCPNCHLIFYELKED